VIGEELEAKELESGGKGKRCAEKVSDRIEGNEK
jgi:hypothetical protein